MIGGIGILILGLAILARKCLKNCCHDEEEIIYITETDEDSIKHTDERRETEHTIADYLFRDD